MTIFKTLSTLSLALALFGGAVVLMPSKADAAVTGQKNNIHSKNNNADNARKQQEKIKAAQEEQKQRAAQEKAKKAAQDKKRNEAKKRSDLIKGQV